MPDAVPHGRPPRLLACSYPCLADPSRGAAWATRDLLALLAGRGWSCQAFCGPQAGFEEGRPPGRLLADLRLPFVARYHAAGGAAFAVAQADLDGVPLTLYCPAPGGDEAAPFLALLDRLLERFRPDLVLTDGGHELAPEVLARARRGGARTVVTLHALGRREGGAFRPADAVLVCSEFARSHYGRTLGRDCTALPLPLVEDRVRCPEVRGRYLTFVNPQPAKGLFLFARLAHELGRRRPDVPLLVVEGRGRASWLGRTGLDLRGPGNLHVRPCTPDPRDFYRVSRLVLVPSLADEPLGRVAAEALVNGIPVLASRRGALPEVLREAGFLFDVPASCTPESLVAPTAEEVAPWVETVLRLWDDAARYDQERRRCLRAAEAWRAERLAERYEAFLGGLAGRGAGAGL